MASLERRAKRLLIRGVAPIFPPRRETEAGAGLTRSPRRIALLRVDDRLGNLLLLTPALDWIARVRPDAELGVVVSSAFASLLANDPRIGRCIVLDKTAQKRAFPIFLADLARVGSLRADAAIECSDRNAFSFSSALYALATRAPRRIGFANDLAARYLSETVEPGPPGHAARDPVRLAAALLGIPAPPLQDCRLSIHLPAPSPAWERWLAGATEGAEGRIVGLHVGGRGRKRWPVDRFATLAHALLDDGLRPWIFRGPLEQEDGETGDPFRDVLARGAVQVPRSGIVPIGQALARCSLVVAPDTGPMHLACAVGTPTLALFLDSQAERYHPIGPEHRWIDARGRALGVDEVRAAAAEMGAAEATDTTGGREIRALGADGKASRR
ncbi:MAG: glycosyltransferase family 9 protein [Candidatus Eisenbacteria bacterium]